MFLLCGLCLAALPQGTQGHMGTEGLTTYGVTQGILLSGAQCLGSSNQFSAALPRLRSNVKWEFYSDTNSSLNNKN